MTSAGSPRVWSARRLPVTLARDIEDQLVDQSSYRCPVFPLAPLVLAVREHDPSFDFKSIELVADRNNLRKLLRWTSGGTNDFRLDVEVAGGTVLLTRWEEKAVEVAGAGYEIGRAHV